jgi:hypothetical protein
VRLLAGIEAGDDGGQVAAAWVATQELRAIYRCRDRDQPANRLYDWTIACIDSGVAELTRLARTITTWRDEFLAYFTTSRISNGPTAAVNLLIKKSCASATDSETSTTTGYACCCTAESPGTIKSRHHYEVAYHV